MNSAITGGEFRGRKLNSPKSSGTHPMGSRERLALFNMITGKLAGATVLDAYAGTGALGLEALSRGARKVTFVENDREALKSLSENIRNLELSEKTTVIKADVRKYVPDEKFDIIIADPPYDKFRSEDFLHLAEYLTDGGVFVVSHPRDMEIKIKGLEIVADRGYAGARITVLLKN